MVPVPNGDEPVSENGFDRRVSPNGLTSRHAHRAKKGDRESFGWLVQRFDRTLRRLIRSQLSESNRAGIDPSDLIQDVWIIVLENIGKIGRPDRRLTPVLSMYLKETANNCLVNRQRAEARKRARFVDIDSADGHVAETTIKSNSILRQSIRESFLSLSEHDRELLDMIIMQKSSIREAARRMGIDRKRISSDLELAVRRLRRAVGPLS